MQLPRYPEQMPAAGILQQINRSDGGLPKTPVEGPVMMTAGGIEGDRHRNLKVHGGPDKAVLMVAEELLNDLIARSYPLYRGALGENLTVTGIDPSAWRAGQRYRIGDAVIELTRKREPCINLYPYGQTIVQELALKENMAGGFYARVIRPGLISPGMPVVLEAAGI